MRDCRGRLPRGAHDLAGHFGFAAGVKAAEQQTPLWALMLGIVCVPLFLMGIEMLEPVAGLIGGYGGNIIHADYTHSLIRAAALSAVFGAAFVFRWGLRGGGVLALVSFSHWVLDLIVHRAGMPLLPGDIGHFAIRIRSLAGPASYHRDRGTPRRGGRMALLSRRPFR